MPRWRTSASPPCGIPRADHRPGHALKASARVDARIQRGALRSRIRPDLASARTFSPGDPRRPVSSRRGFSWMGIVDAPGPAGPPFGLSSCKGTIMHVSFLATASTLALALSACRPAHARAAQTDLYRDVATHAMPGAPGMGALGRLAGAMGGQRASYGMARHPGMPGKYLDVALYNRRAPGQPASQAVPKSLHVGDSIDLLPPAKPAAATDGQIGGAAPPGLADGGTYTVHYYWGCGSKAGAGQPARYSMTVRNGKPVQSGRAMAPRQVPQSGPDVGPQHVLWPNPDARRTTPDKASLAGTHRL